MPLRLLPFVIAARWSIPPLALRPDPIATARRYDDEDCANTAQVPQPIDREASTWRTSRPAMAARWHLGATILCNPSASLLQELPLCASAASHVCCLRCTKTKGMLHAHTKATKYGTMGAAVCCLHRSLLGSDGRGNLVWEKKKTRSI